ncbi:MAG: HEAT repeat domain-containing protein [Myxococcota bacterium]
MARPIAKDLKRALQAFARAIRARHLYRSNNAAFIRAMRDLGVQLEGLLVERDVIALSIRPDSMVFEDEVVFEEPNPDESIPFLLYRDGMRRLELRAGLSADELEALVSSIAEGFASHGLGDDVISTLWRHDLQHIHYIVVDSDIGDAAPTREGSPGMELAPIDAQVSALLGEIYGKGDADVGFQVAHVDALDLKAKSIAEALDDVDEMGREFHPARRLEVPPPYLAELLTESTLETEHALSMRIVVAALEGLAAPELSDNDKATLGDRLLNFYDGFIVGGSFGRAAQVIMGLRQLEQQPEGWAIAQGLITQALSDARLRQAVAQLGATGGEDVLDVFRAAGPAAVHSLLALIPAVDDPNYRRAFSDLALELGIRDLKPIEPLLTDAQAYVAREAIHILSRLDTDAARLKLAEAERHPMPPVRQALATVLPALGRQLSIEVGSRLLDDPEQDVATAAARALGTSRDARAAAAIETRMNAPEFMNASLPMKQAFVAAYALIAQNQGVPTLARYLKEGDGILAKREQEDLAVAATQALGFLRTPGAIAALEKSASCLNKRVREASREALRRAGVAER